MDPDQLKPRPGVMNCPLVACAALALIGFGGLGCQGPGPKEEPKHDVVSFTDVTQASGLGEFRHETGAFGRKWMPETLGAGGGFIDYDGDGWLDVLLVGGAVWPGRGKAVPALRLYRNRRNGTFSQVTDEVGFGNVSAYGFGVTTADYDGDDDEDIFLTTLAENRLFRNDGGTFSDVGRDAGLADHHTWSTAAIFFDANRDGRLDLYVGNYVPWSPETDKWCTSDGETKDYCTPHQYDGTPAHFYENNGDGTFSERTQDVGLAAGPGKTLGVASLDFNRDGWMDIVVANDTQRNLLYRNSGDGTFQEIGVESGVAYDMNGRVRAGMGIDAAVLDESGFPTIAIGNFSEEMVGLFTYQNSGLFIDRAAAAGVGMPSFQPLTFGLFFFDADLDGRLDLLLVNGHIMEHIEEVQPTLSYRQPAQLFLGQDGGTFHLFSPARDGVLDHGMVGRGAAYADYDRDGDLDVLITENGGPAHLWRNDVNPAPDGRVHVLRVQLEGAFPNRDAIGARIVAVAGNARQERLVRMGSSYLSQSEKTATFGLGSATQVDTLRIYWPSGREDIFEDVRADQTVRLVEGREALEQLALADTPRNPAD